MPDFVYPITTGLSIELMDKFDTYQANAVRLLTAAEFPEDITVSLRRQINKDITETIDLMARNPRFPVIPGVQAEPELPRIIPRDEPVFAPDVVEPDPAPVAEG